MPGRSINIKNDSPDKIQVFYKKLIETDAKIKNLQSMLTTESNEDNDYEDTPYRTKRSLKLYDNPNNYELYRKKRGVYNLKKTIPMKKFRIKKFTMASSSESENITGQPVGIVIEKKKIFVKYNPYSAKKLVAKCSHSPKDIQLHQHEHQLKHPFYQNTQRLDELLDKLIRNNIPDIMTDLHLLGKNKNKMCKHPINDAPKSKIKKIINKPVNEMPDPGTIRLKEDLTSSMDWKKVFESIDTTTHKKLKSESVMIENSKTPKPEGKKSVKSKETPRSEKPSLRHLMQIEGEEEENLGYEDFKEVLTDDIESQDDTEKVVERAKRWQFNLNNPPEEDIFREGPAAEKELMSSKNNPTSMHNPNWKGPMPLYPDELNALFKQHHTANHKKNPQPGNVWSEGHISKKPEMKPALKFYSPPTLHNPNWKGAMPLYPDELSTLFKHDGPVMNKPETKNKYVEGVIVKNKKFTLSTKYSMPDVQNPNWKGPMPPLYPDELSTMLKEHSPRTYKKPKDIQIECQGLIIQGPTRRTRSDVEDIGHYLDNKYEKMAEMAQAYSDYGVLEDKKNELKMDKKQVKETVPVGNRVQLSADWHLFPRGLLESKDIRHKAQYGTKLVNPQGLVTIKLTSDAREDPEITKIISSNINIESPPKVEQAKKKKKENHQKRKHHKNIGNYLGRNLLSTLFKRSNFNSLDYDEKPINKRVNYDTTDKIKKNTQIKRRESRHKKKVKNKRDNMHQETKGDFNYNSMANLENYIAKTTKENVNIYGIDYSSVFSYQQTTISYDGPPNLEEYVANVTQENIKLYGIDYSNSYQPTTDLYINLKPPTSNWQSPSRDMYPTLNSLNLSLVSEPFQNLNDLGPITVNLQTKYNLNPTLEEQNTSTILTTRITNFSTIMEKNKNLGTGLQHLVKGENKGLSPSRIRENMKTRSIWEPYMTFVNDYTSHDIYESKENSNLDMLNRTLRFATSKSKHKELMMTEDSIDVDKFTIQAECENTRTTSFVDKIYDILKRLKNETFKYKSDTECKNNNSGRGKGSLIKKRETDVKNNNVTDFFGMITDWFQNVQGKKVDSEKPVSLGGSRMLLSVTEDHRAEDVRASVTSTADYSESMRVNSEINSTGNDGNITVYNPSTVYYNITTVKNRDSLTEPLNKDSNKKLVKRNVDESNLVFWNDIYDDNEYGILTNNAADAMQSKLYPKETDFLERSGRWVQDKIKKFADNIRGREQDLPLEKPLLRAARSFRQEENPQHDVIYGKAKRNGDHKDFEKDAYQKTIFLHLSSRMADVCKKAAESVKEMSKSEVQDDQNSSGITTNMMQQLVRLLTDLIDYQIQANTCAKLPSDLKQFLEWLILSDKDNVVPTSSKSVTTSQVTSSTTPANPEDDVMELVVETQDPTETTHLAPVNLNDRPANKFVETIRSVEDLLQEYDSMDDQNKRKLAEVKTYLQNRLVSLQGELRNYSARRSNQNKRGMYSYGLPLIRGKRKANKFLKHFGKKHTRTTASFYDGVMSTEKKIFDSKQKMDGKEYKRNLKDVYYKAVADAKKYAAGGMNGNRKVVGFSTTTIKV